MPREVAAPHGMSRRRQVGAAGDSCYDTAGARYIGERWALSCASHQSALHRHSLRIILKMLQANNRDEAKAAFIKLNYRRGHGGPSPSWLARV